MKHVSPYVLLKAVHTLLEQKGESSPALMQLVGRVRANLLVQLFNQNLQVLVRLPFQRAVKQILARYSDGLRQTAISVYRDYAAAQMAVDTAAQGMPPAQPGVLTSRKNSWRLE